MCKISMTFFTVVLVSSVGEGHFFNKAGFVQKPDTAGESLKANAIYASENEDFVESRFCERCGFNTLAQVLKGTLSKQRDSLNRLEEQVRSLESWRSEMDDTYKRQSERLDNLHMQFEIYIAAVLKNISIFHDLQMKNEEAIRRTEEGMETLRANQTAIYNNEIIPMKSKLEKLTCCSTEITTNGEQNFTKPPFLEEAYSGYSTDKITTESAGPDNNEVPDLCENASINSITTTRDDSTYVFKGNFYWKVNPDGNKIESGYPRIISEDWDGLPGFIDASLTWENGIIVFFKGRHYWKFTDKSMHPGYPKLISEGFKGIPDYLDAAVVVHDDPNAYFFKGRKYWRYDTDIRGVRPEYPKNINLFWTGLPDDMDAAFRFRNKSYFFKGQIYYRIDHTYGVDPIHFGGYKRYPLSIAVEWFGCTKLG